MSRLAAQNCSHEAKQGLRLALTCFNFLPELMELAKAGASVPTALELEVMGAPGATPRPLLMALATADCPGDPTAVAVSVPVATAAAKARHQVVDERHSGSVSVQ